MARLFVCDDGGWITVDIEACGPVSAALEHDKAEVLIRCALFMALSALAEGEQWPMALLQAMAGFMSTMKDTLCSDRLM